MEPDGPQDARPAPRDAVPQPQDAVPPGYHAPAAPGPATAATAAAARQAPARTALDAFLLLGPIWLIAAVTAPLVAGVILAALWSRKTGFELFVLPGGFALLTLMIALASRPGRVLVRARDTGSLRGRLPWAAGVCLLGTLLVAAGAGLWRHDPAPFGSAAARMWWVGLAYALAAAVRSRLRVLRLVALAGSATGVVLALGLVMGSASHGGQPANRPAPQAAPTPRIPVTLLRIGDTPAGYAPVAGSISEEGDGPSPFLATYSCVAHCPPDTSPGQAATIMFEAAPGGPDDFSVYQGLCGPNPSQGYVCAPLAPSMWRATVPSSPTVYQSVIYEHGGIEYTLQAPPQMDPRLLRAYMMSIHPASDAELVSLLKGYPDYS